jgi:hypothetical protein
VTCRDGGLKPLQQQRWLRGRVAAQSSKYQCDGNDKYDARGNHQNFEGIIARNVIV